MRLTPSAHTGVVSDEVNAVSLAKYERVFPRAHCIAHGGMMLAPSAGNFGDGEEGIERIHALIIAQISYQGLDRRLAVPASQ